MPLGLTHEDTLQARLDKLDAFLEQTSTSRQGAASLPKCYPFQMMDAIRRSI